LLNLAERNQPALSGSPRIAVREELLLAARSRAVKMEFATFEMMGVLAKRSAELGRTKSSLRTERIEQNGRAGDASSLFEQAVS